MGPSMFLISISTTFLLSLTSLFHISVTSSLSNLTHSPLCHDDERSALLQFKDGFLINMQVSVDDPLAYPKVESWKLVGEQNCCQWHGVDCDDVTGHVIGIDLSSSCLYGSINSSNSLFRLVHLRKLNIAFNHFNYSLIPSTFSYLSKLTYLNLSNSFFSGQIPSNISDLSRLSSLDLSFNDRLFLMKPTFRSLVRNFTNLEVLNLNFVDISTHVPDILSNITSLTSIRLKYCGLYGKFPAGILHLPKLQVISFAYNPNLVGHLPEFYSNSPLTILSFGFTNLSGELPKSIGNLNSLTYLNLDSCNLLGKFPSSLTNLTQLDDLTLSTNPFSLQSTSSLSWIGQLSKLKHLYLNNIQLYGEIPLYLVNLTQLYSLSLRHNHLTGPISWRLMNITQLSLLHLSWNRLQGQILSANSNASTVQKFSELGLAGCNLYSFPNFLRHQDKLVVLELSGNNIHGQIPEWVMNVSTSTLEILDLSGNFLAGFKVNPVVFQWDKIRAIDIRCNLLRASFPVPPQSIVVYSVGDNRMYGEISPSFCNLTSLYVLDVHDNFLSGTLPSCLGYSATHMDMMDLGGNNFQGTIPQAFKKACKLHMMALNDNRFQGGVPKTLAYCTMLEFLNFGNNHLNDVFPSWLEKLPNLEVLILRSNHFHGILTGHNTEFDFPKLHIIDLSQNNFSGQLPANYFFNWTRMKMVEANSTYMESTKRMGVTSLVKYRQNTYFEFNDKYSMSITNKGVKLKYTQILRYFIAIDLSCNRFKGDIPAVMGDLKGLHLLNLSHNNFNGSIPSSFANLTELESLDLSQNNLSGEIPSGLVQLNFLAVFNVSHNYLTGPIPLGKQFDTFQNDSYQGNLGLCGKILPRKCANLESLPPAATRNEDGQGSSSRFTFGWEPVVIGYGCGLIFGLVIGHVVAIKKYDWLMKTFRIRVRPHRKRGNIMSIYCSKIFTYLLQCRRVRML